jgi:hypothetical protein
MRKMHRYEPEKVERDGGLFLGRKSGILWHIKG